MLRCYAKGKTPRTRTNQEECGVSPNRRRDRRTGRNSQAISSEPLPPTGDGGEKTNTDISPRLPVGGIVAQLIEQTVLEIEENQKHGDRLQARLLTLYGLKSSLEKE